MGSKIPHIFQHLMSRGFQGGKVNKESVNCPRLTCVVAVFILYEVKVKWGKTL